LIQQWLEDVVVAAVENGNVHGLSAKTARRVEPTESAADDYDTRHRNSIGNVLAILTGMATTDRLVRWGGARLSRVMSRSMPLIGTAIALATVAATMKRKGFFGGILDTGLNAIPFVGAAKNTVEIVRGRDFFPDREIVGRPLPHRR